jgi:hypothetical protein
VQQVDPDRSPGSLGELPKRGSHLPTPGANGTLKSPATVVKSQNPRWFELEKYSAIRDLILVIGFLTLVAVIFTLGIPYSKQAAIFILGLGLMYLAILMGK